MNLVLGYLLCLGIMIPITIVSSFIHIKNEPEFVYSCMLILGLELSIMEPFRTLLKAIGYLIFNDLGLLSSYCERL
jgi:hypothetical protein